MTSVTTHNEAIEGRQLTLTTMANEIEQMADAMMSLAKRMRDLGGFCSDDLVRHSFELSGAANIAREWAIEIREGVI